MSKIYFCLRVMRLYCVELIPGVNVIRPIIKKKFRQWVWQLILIKAFRIPGGISRIYKWTVRSVDPQAYHTRCVSR